jgi:hypothetical protein
LSIHFSEFHTLQKTIVSPSPSAFAWATAARSDPGPLPF